MRLLLGDITREPVAEAAWLTDHVIRYRLVTDPTAVYYANGRDCIVATPQQDGRVALRKNDPPQSWAELPENEECLVCSPGEAEQVALGRLSRVRLLRLTARKDAQSAELTLRCAGEQDKIRGYRHYVHIASLQGQDFRVETCGGSRELEPCRVWYEFRPLGHTIECCATCEHFAMSGMTRDMSGGSKGYCLAQGPPSGQTLVSVTHVCPEYTPVPRVPRHLGGPPRP